MSNHFTMALARWRKPWQNFHTIRRFGGQRRLQGMSVQNGSFEKHNHHAHNFWCHKCALRILRFNKHNYADVHWFSTLFQFNQNHTHKCEHLFNKKCSNYRLMVFDAAVGVDSCQLLAVWLWERKGTSTRFHMFQGFSFSTKNFAPPNLVRNEPISCSFSMNLNDSAWVGCIRR